MENWGRGRWGRGLGRREGGRREGKGGGKRRVALCAGALGVCPGKGAGGRGQRRAPGHDDSWGLLGPRGAGTGREGEGEPAGGRGALGRGGLPLPEAGVS